MVVSNSLANKKEEIKKMSLPARSYQRFLTISSSIFFIRTADSKEVKEVPLAFLEERKEKRENLILTWPRS